MLQDDVLFENLTVQQTLEYTSRLRLSKNMSRKEKMQKVDEIIDVLNLEKARNTIIGGPFKRYYSRIFHLIHIFSSGVSGGERKRVNIGNELLTRPSMILLDE